jgi:hypothetical protein
MAKNHYLSEMFWVDEYIAELDPSEKLLFNYLLTNHFINCYGIYQIPLRNIAFDTGIDKDAVLRILERFNRDNKISYWDGKYIVIHNFYKFQSYNLREVRDFVLRSLNDLPSELRLAYPDVIQNLKARVLASERPVSGQPKGRKTPAGHTHLIQSKLNDTDLYQSSSSPQTPQGGEAAPTTTRKTSNSKDAGEGPRTPQSDPVGIYDEGVALKDSEAARWEQQFPDLDIYLIAEQLSNWAKAKGETIEHPFSAMCAFGNKEMDRRTKK